MQRRLARRAFAVILVGLSGALASAGSPQDAFDRLYGKEYERATKTPTRQDDVELARRLLKAMKLSALEPGMVALLSERICSLAGNVSPGYAIALEALDLRACACPADRIQCLECMVRIRRLQLRSAYGARKRRIGHTVVDLLAELGDSRYHAGAFEAAVPLYQQALDTARYYQSPRYAELRAALAKARHYSTVHERVAELKECLGKNPGNDAARAELVGLCVAELDDPREAAKHLAAGDDGETARNVRLAARGLAGLPPTPTLQVAGWYGSLAETASKLAQPRIWRKAERYYTRFLELHSVEDLARAKAKAELERIRSRLGGTKPPQPHTLDLLPLVQPGRDAIKGTWTRTGDDLRVAAGSQAGARLTVPVAPRGDYELLLNVSRGAGPDSCNIGLPVGRTHVTLIVDGERGTVIGLGHIDGVKYFKTPTARKLPVFGDGKPHTILVQVRTREDRAQILVSVDGRPVIRWVGEQESLKPDDGVKPTHPEAILLGSTRTEYIFHRIQLRMLTGKAQRLRPRR